MHVKEVNAELRRQRYLRKRRDDVADGEEPRKKRKKRVIDDRKILDKLIQDKIGCGVSCKAVKGDYVFKCQTCLEIFHKACLCEMADCEQWAAAFCLGCRK